MNVKILMDDFGIMEKGFFLFGWYCLGVNWEFVWDVFCGSEWWCCV